MNINPLKYLYLLLFVVYFLAPCDDIYYRSRTNPCIKISINFIDSYWITDIYREFFEPYINKVKYCLKLIWDVFRHPLYNEYEFVNIESYHAYAH